MSDREVKMIRKQVREEYYPNRFAQAIKATNNATVTKNVVEDTKQAEKFEPHYKNEKSIKTTVKIASIDDLFDK
jgi:hypothetical protein